MLKFLYPPNMSIYPSQKSHIGRALPQCPRPEDSDTVLPTLLLRENFYGSLVFDDTGQDKKAKDRTRSSRHQSLTTHSSGGIASGGSASSYPGGSSGAVTVECRDRNFLRFGRTRRLEVPSPRAIACVANGADRRRKRERVVS